MSEHATAADVACHASVAFVVVRDGAVTWHNDAARRLVGPHGGTWGAGDAPLELLRSVRRGAQQARVRWPSPVGGARWWQVACRSLRPADPTLLYEIVDETSHHEDVLGVRNSQWRLSRLEAMAGMGSWDWDPLDDTMHWSDALLRLFGIPEGGSPDLAAFIAMAHPEDAPMIVSTVAEALRTGEPFAYTARFRLPDHATMKIFEVYAEIVADAAGAPMRVLGAARDVTEQHRARQELAYLAEHDPLTGVANRRRVTAWLADCAERADGGALLLIDVDNFKDINDLRGHAVGDRVMRSLAHTVSARIGSDALLGRLGGDEFAVVVPFGDAENGLELGERLCDAVARTPIADAGSSLQVTISVGVADVAPGREVETSLARADLALYEAKRAGRNRARRFAPDQYHQAVRRVSLLQRVADALDSNTMELDAQPIVDLNSGATVRHELLIRLRDGLSPELGPADFLPAAERTDLVLQLDRWVLDHAVTALAAPAARAADMRLDVNVSARSLEDDELGDWILALLRRHGVEPRRLGLEITETAAVNGLDGARSLAVQLIEAGCGFALDDFGSGFGSFAYLKHLRFTAVKIGGDFVKALDADRIDRALVAAVVGVASDLGMTTVAEQVDRAALVDLLRRLGVDHGQGYHLGRPRPLGELLAGR
ncbi:putative bifunctional diguanylate cyclase/phosphodiesterase [Pseudonocardia sp. GCM10023141]|uniref:putative bifunctional diguanylate cyclase/phosphodiesterase n=1 Tax=Pseudonocardia sp. GCM10023141 TaxID=3252653 RepID=UPI0036073F93